MFQKHQLLMTVTLCAFFVAMIISSSCNDPSFVGSDLLEDDLIDSEVRKDFDMRAQIVPTDSVLVYDGFPLSSNFHIGTYRNDQFGTVNSKLVLQLLRTQSAVDTSENIVIDSVILSLAYQSTNFFGDSTQPVSLEVLRMADYQPRDGRYYSNEMYPLQMDPLGRIDNFYHKPTTLLTRIIDQDDDENGSDTVMLAPQIRIPLDKQLGEELLSLDTIAAQSDSAFIAIFGGVYIRQVMGEKTLAGINLNNAATALTVYYNADDERRIKRYIPEEGFVLRSLVYDHDYTSSGLESQIGEWQDSLLVVQGLTGLGTRIEITGMEDLRESLINSAELRIVLDDRKSETGVGIFPEIPALALRSVESDGSIPLITDLLLEQTTNITINFGGRLSQEVIEGDTMSVYKMNITTHLQEALKKDDKTMLLLTPRSRLGVPGNTRMFGPSHPDYPMKLRVIYTR